MGKLKEFIVVHAPSWEEARGLAGHMFRWHFRGQASDQWDLATSVERATTPAYKQFLGTIEGGFVYEFQRRAHHYLASPPSDTALLEWLALLQHYGCPTRLLDFTHSFYVAAFFAVEQAAGDAAVWAIDQEKLNVAADAILQRSSSMSGDLGIADWNRRNIEVAESFIGKDTKMNLVVDVEPVRLNERVSIQRGNFLFPCNLGTSFMDNLLATFNITNDARDDAHKHPTTYDSICADDLEGASIIKIVVPKTCHGTALTDLRNMNITSATLFPGLDGFARSLRYALQSAADKDWHTKWDAFCEKKPVPHSTV